MYERGGHLPAHRATRAPEPLPLCPVHLAGASVVLAVTRIDLVSGDLLRTVLLDAVDECSRDAVRREPPGFEFCDLREFDAMYPGVAMYAGVRDSRRADLTERLFADPIRGRVDFPHGDSPGAPRLTDRGLRRLRPRADGA